MKKVFRVAWVCALAGATLLYTGCTKDYSEDLSGLTKRVEKTESDITSINSQILSINSAINGLEGADAEAMRLITALNTWKDEVDPKITKAVGDIETLQGNLQNLEGIVNGHTTDIASIRADLAKKADKTYVDGELAKKADKTWVEATLENYVTVQTFNKHVADFDAAMTLVNQSISNVKKSLDSLAGEHAELAKTVGEMQVELSEVKKTANAALDSAKRAQGTADQALSKALEVEKALEAYAKKDWVNSLLDQMRADYNTKIAAKVDTAVYSQKMAEIDAKFVEVDSAIVRVIRGYQEGDAILNARIDSLDEAVTKALGAKLDTTTFNEYVAAIRKELDGINRDIQTLFNRVQSLVYVPEYDDSRITFNWAYLGVPNQEAVPADGTSEGGNTATNGVGEPSATLDDEPEGESDVIVLPTEVKYRVYGVDAAEIVESLVANVNEAVEAREDPVLSFDVVRVKTRANKDGVSVKILGAEVDDLDDNTITLTILPVGIPDLFYFGTWLNDGYYNTSLRAQIGAVEDFPAFSMSLVLTDEGTEEKPQSRFITSTYENVVPAEGELIAINIVKDSVDITNNAYVDTVKIPYVDLNPYAILEGHQLMFKLKGENYTADELAEMNIYLPKITVEIEDTPDFSKAIDESKLPKDYIIVTKDVTTIPGTAEANLKAVIKEGVGAESHVVFTYKVGSGYEVLAGALVQVVPDQVAVVVDIWESKTLVPFTWNYDKDAAVDAAILAGGAELYARDSAWADDAAAIEILKAKEIATSDFARKVPAVEKSFYSFFYTDEKGNVVEKKVRIDSTAFNIAPWFDADNNNKLMAEVTNFNFCDPELGALDSVKYIAVYFLPSEAQPYTEVTVTGKIIFADRDRTPIIVNLPETFEPFVVNYKKVILDTLYDDAHALVPQFPEGTYADHSLTDANLIDAYTKDLYNRTDSLTMTVEDEVITRFARRRIITTVSEDVEKHVLDYNTDSDVNVSWAAGKVIEPYQTFQSIDTLWYGQVVIVNKNVKWDVDGIYEFERIPEYVAKTDNANYYTTLQPWWKPDGSTTDFTIPVDGYDAHQVLLNQHFRVVDVLKSIETGEKVVCTEVATTDNVKSGDFKPEYAEILNRMFMLEEPGHVGEQVTFIDDPRAEDTDLIAELNAAIAASGLEGVEMGVKIDSVKNIVSYYSKSEQEDAIGNLFVVNTNGSKVAMTTNFNRGAAAPSPRLAEAGVVVENYENYVIKLYDPLSEIVYPEDVQKINVNNSIITKTSIYQFITLKDKRGFDLIGANEVQDEVTYGWIIGNDENGFAEGVSTDKVYSLVFANDIEYLTEISEETKSRISFDKKTGILTYDNTLQTQLAVPIDMKLTVNIEYPWGTRAAEVTVEFYNKPVGE